MDLHLVKTDGGYAIVDRRPGPYSFSGPIDTPVLEVTGAQWRQFNQEMKAVNTPAVPEKTQEPT